MTPHPLSWLDHVDRLTDCLHYTRALTYALACVAQCHTDQSLGPHDGEPHWEDESAIKREEEP